MPVDLTQDMQQPQEIPAGILPNPAKYDPTNPVPYQAAKMPDVAPPPQQPFESNASPSVRNPPKSTVGGIAMGLDSIFRGYMNGKTQGEAQKLMQVKQQTDNLQAAYNMAAENLKKVAESGADPNSDEYKSAKSAVDGTWGALTDYYGQHITPADGAKKKSSKKQQQPDSPITQIQSEDPQQKMQGLYQVMKKVGAPVYHQLPSPDAVKQGNQRQQVQQETTDLEAQHKNHVAQLTAQRDKLMGVPNRTPEQEAALKGINAELNPQPKSADEMKDSANEIVQKHLKDGKPFTMAEAQIIEAATGHKVTPRTITAKNPKTGEVAIATPNEQGEYEWHTDKVFEGAAGGKGSGGGKPLKPIPEGLAAKIQGTKDKSVDLAMKKWKQGLDAKDQIIPGPHTFDGFLNDMQTAQNNYENSIRATGHPIEHVNVRDHIVMDGNRQGEWLDDNHNKSAVKGATITDKTETISEPKPIAVNDVVTVKGKKYTVGKMYPDGTWDPK